MPALEPATDADLRSDAEVIAAIREGDTIAIDELYRRHHCAAMSFAESIAGRTLAPDLVSEAFLRILDLLQRGGGPTLVFRSYLYTTIRNLYIDHIRHHSRQTSLPDFGPLEAEFALGDGLDDHFEHSLVKKAFSSLPERWQVALWYTTVEGVSLEDAGTFLGVAPNAVAALTFRAREGLRQAYLAEHLNLTAEQTCAEVWEVLPRYVRGGLRGRTRAMVDEHLPECRGCSAAVLELDEVNSNLRGILAIALLGPTTAGLLYRAVGTVKPVPVPSTRAQVGVSGLSKVGVAVGTAAAAGLLVLAWPHHDAAHHDSARPPARSAIHPSRPSDHPSPTAATPSPGTPAAAIRARSASYPQPSTSQPGVVVGTPTWTRLTTSTPSWFHVGVPIATTGVAPGDLTLVISASSWTAYHVHREAGFGAWSCAGQRTGQLRCRLAPGADRVDLGFDVQTPGRLVLHVSVVRTGDDPVSTAVTVG